MATPLRLTSNDKILEKNCYNTLGFWIWLSCEGVEGWWVFGWVLKGFYRVFVWDWGLFLGNGKVSVRILFGLCYYLSGRGSLLCVLRARLSEILIRVLSRSVSGFILLLLMTSSWGGCLCLGCWVRWGLSVGGFSPLLLIDPRWGN